MERNTGEYSNRHEDDDDDERTYYQNAMIPFARTIHRAAPELSREISGLGNRETEEPVSWLDRQPEDKTELSDSGLLIYQAYRESTRHLEPDQMKHLAHQVKCIVELPAKNEIDALQDRAIITDALGEETPKPSSTRSTPCTWRWTWPPRK